MTQEGGADIHLDIDQSGSKMEVSRGAETIDRILTLVNLDLILLP